MSEALCEALRKRTGSANRRVDPDTMEEFFTGWGMDGNIMEPEKLPPMSGPVTMDDGTVLVPHSTGLAGPYKSLRSVLDEAFNHASAGKGLERHACGEPFEQQTICQTARAHGIGFCTGQAEKKGRESHRLLPMDGGVDRAVSELLGAINYLAAAVIVIREGK